VKSYKSYSKVNQKKQFLLIILAISLIIFVAYYFIISDTSWKLFSDQISSETYYKLYAKHDGFIGLEIDRVIKMLSKQGEDYLGYFIIEKDDSTEIQNCPSYEVSARNNSCFKPIGESVAVYCFYIHSSNIFAREEAYIVGFFVNENNRVIKVISEYEAY